ncbi:MAG: helix-turn-helix transcriptional regulator [Anaerovibrio sp.]|uniref:helix-turn-helix transcriptional regulator n=1 Tax=Anaerovibrio sp. TaxID=1872532 RepID=UPI0025FB78B2|nr:helix-turn-helix transcriptional regulator [Anaerovibrio sp.]MCR5177001.1 helix-turn-helix transcriptional regulator [Anaerovibrio sp.]
MKQILLPYISMAEMLAKTFGDDCEVVIHDLADPAHSVVYVANNSVTGRRVGDSFDQLIKKVILSEKLKDDYVANYYFDAPNGKKIRSSTLLIKDDKGKLAGALCINLDTTRLSRHIEYLQSFLPGQRTEETGQASEADKEPDNVNDMITRLMEGIIGSEGGDGLTRDGRIEKIRFMDEKGIFLMKGSVEKAAEMLGVNKVTIYSYLDEVRGKRG